MLSFPPPLAVYLVLSLGAGWWVYGDAIAHGLAGGRALSWAAGTVLLLAAVLPAYLVFGRPPQRDAGVWGLGEVVGGVGAVFVLGLIVIQLFQLNSARLPDLATGIVLQELVMILIVAYVVLSRYRLPLTSIGVRGGGLRLVWLGAGLSLLSIPLSTLAEQVAMEIAGMVVGPVQAQRMNDYEHAIVPIDRILRGAAGADEIALIIVLICVVVPVAEEVFFRGFAYGAMRARWHRTVAVIVSAAFFAAVHLQIIHFLPIFALGVVLAYAYERTGSLLPAVVIHGINNLVAVLVTLRSTG
ncbi:MAG TPA: CPBP family intramembrane glutamic endopeptidase [bacterium]